MTANKQAKHTPGPYKAEYRFKGPRDKVIEIKDGGGFVLAEIPRKRPQAEQEANATLFEAAPDLLAACKAIHNLSRDNGPNITGPQWRDMVSAIATQAGAAIRKATSRE